MTVFLFEGPHRIARLLREIAEISGPQTRVALIREATKLHEECCRGTAAEVLASRREDAWRGEFVVAVDWRGAEAPGEAGDPEEEAGEGSPCA